MINWIKNVFKKKEKNQPNLIDMSVLVNSSTFNKITNTTRITFKIPVRKLSTKESQDLLRKFMRNMMQPIQEKDIRIYKIGKILERMQQPK
jgi:hypothetical protein